MPRCSVCEIRKEQVETLKAVVAQQASVIEALSGARDAVRPAVASRPQDDDVDERPQFPEQIQQSIVRVAGFEGPLRDHLESWAQDALSFGMSEEEVARKIFEGDND